MGHFKLIVTGEIGIDDIIGKFRDENDYARYALDSKGHTAEECKWYSCVEDVLKLSKEHPDILFLLEGEGEEAGDIWKFYAKNGRSCFQEAKIIFDEFDESMLELPKLEADDE
jgi:hypothetical protein